VVGGQKSGKAVGRPREKLGKSQDSAWVGIPYIELLRGGGCVAWINIEDTGYKTKETGKRHTTNKRWGRANRHTAPKFRRNKIDYMRDETHRVITQKT